MSSSLAQSADETTTTDDAAAVTVGDTFALPTDSVTTVDVQASCIEEGSGIAKVINVRRHFKNAADTVTASTQRNTCGPETVGGASAASVAITNTGTTGRVDVTGPADIAAQWRVDRQVVTVHEPASALADFDFSTLFVAPYGGGGTWTGAASAGTSEGQDLTKLDTLSLGTAVNGVQPVVYDDAETGCHIGGPTVSDAYGETGGTILILAKMLSEEANSTHTENNPGLVSATGSVFQMGWSESGLRVSVWNGASVDAPAIDVAIGGWHLFAGRYTATAVQASIDGSTFGDNSTAAEPPTLATSSLIVGSNYAYTGGKIADAEVLFVGTFARAITDGELTSILGILDGMFPAAGLL